MSCSVSCPSLAELDEAIEDEERLLEVEGVAAGEAVLEAEEIRLELSSGESERG